LKNKLVNIIKHAVVLPICHWRVTAENGDQTPLQIVTAARPFGHSSTN